MEYILQRSQYLYPTLVEECLDLPVRTIKSEIRFDFFFSKKEGILIEDLAINLLGEQIETDLSLVSGLRFARWLFSIFCSSIYEHEFSLLYYLLKGKLWRKLKAKAEEKSATG